MSCSTEGISNAYNVLQMRQPVQSTTTTNISLPHNLTTNANFTAPTIASPTPITAATVNSVASTSSSSNTPSLSSGNSQSLLPQLNVDTGNGSRIMLQGPDETVEYEQSYLSKIDYFTDSQWWRHVVAGGLAGAISRTCTAPLDRTKVMLQVKGAQFTSMWSCFKHMVAEGGKISLWRGNGMNVIKIAPDSALKFLVYEEAKLAIKSDTDQELDIRWRFLAGSIAGSVSQTVIYPLEVLKTRLCLRHTGQYKSARDAFVKIYRNEGFKAFYRGYLANLCGIIPFAGIDLAVYETLKNYFLSTYESDEPDNYITLSCGFISSSCGIIIPYPLSLIRTRLQAHSGNDPNMSSIRSVVSHINKTEGLRGFYRGLTINIFKGVPAVTISYIVYENARSTLGATMT